MSIVKRSIDLLLSGILLVLLAPPMLAIAFAVAATSSGPVIYRQVRLGLHGRPFNIHKFRTLHDGGQDERRVAPAGDPRITTVGAFLRRTRLDELPQLYDVLRGKMSLVGPRPETPALLAGVPDSVRRTVFSVRPGMTGPAALAFFCEDEVLAHVADPERSYRERLVPAKMRWDARYARNRSLAEDFVLLGRTIAILCDRRQNCRCVRRIRRLLSAG